MKIKLIPNPVLKLREFNSCQSCTRRYKLAPAQAGRWPPSGQLSCVNHVFLMLGIWHCIFSGFTARHKAPEQSSLMQFFKGPELFYTASSSAPFTCWNFAKTSLCETGLASSASRYGSPHGDQRCCNAVAKVEAVSAQLLQFVLVDLIAEGNRLPGDQRSSFISLLDKTRGKSCSGMSDVRTQQYQALVKLLITGPSSLQKLLSSVPAACQVPFHTKGDYVYPWQSAQCQGEGPWDVSSSGSLHAGLRWQHRTALNSWLSAYSSSADKYTQVFMRSKEWCL